MKHTKFIALCLSLALPAFAEEAPKEGDGAKTPKKPDMKQIFKKKDKDGDGFLSKDEFVNKKAKDPAKAEAAFTKKDKDGDGKLSEEEFTARGKRKAK
jgi:hypothetical protein